jgi:hypothetical protein
MADIYAALTEQLALVGSVSPQLIDNNTADTEWIDMSKWRRVAFLLLVGATDITLDFKLRASAASDGSNPVDISGYAVTQLTAAGGDNDRVWIEITAAKMATLNSGAGYRYLSGRVTVGDGTLGANVAVAAFGAVARYEPASDGDLASVVETIRNV